MKYEDACLSAIFLRGCLNLKTRMDTDFKAIVHDILCLWLFNVHGKLKKELKKCFKMN